MEKVIFEKFNVRARSATVDLVLNDMCLAVEIEINIDSEVFYCTLIDSQGDERCYFNLAISADKEFRIVESSGRDLYIGQDIISHHKQALINEYELLTLRSKNFHS